MMSGPRSYFALGEKTRPVILAAPSRSVRTRPWKGSRMSSKPPPNTPFGHGDRCKTPDAEPEWYDDGAGRWERVCSCGSEYKAMDTGELEPAGQAAEPAKTAHEHFPECEGAQVASMVQVEFSSADGCWRSHCLLCTSTFQYGTSSSTLTRTLSAGASRGTVRRRLHSVSTTLRPTPRQPARGCTTTPRSSTPRTSRPPRPPCRSHRPSRVEVRPRRGLLMTRRSRAATSAHADAR